MEMTRDTLGGFEREVLAVVRRMAGSAYGAAIAEGITNDTGREPSSGAIYTTLERLERKGFISSRWGDPTAERGGRRKRHYKLEALGAAALNQNTITRTTPSQALATA